MVMADDDGAEEEEEDEYSPAARQLLLSTSVHAVFFGLQTDVRFVIHATLSKSIEVGLGLEP